LHKNLHLQINVLLSAGVPTVSNVTQSLAWHYPEVATVAADFRICKAPPAPTRPSAASAGGPTLPVASDQKGALPIAPPGKRNGQYRHDERTKAAISERRKFSALLKMLRDALT
jgi:hypothetical protein